MKVKLIVFFALISFGVPVAGFAPLSICTAYKSDSTRFSFAFITDAHIKPDSVVVTAFSKVIDSINNAGVDFVISGGDQVYDVMRGNQAKSDSLFTLYKTLSSRIKAPVYNTVGNHELFGIYEESPEDSTHADYKYGMFERHFGDTYYAFNHKGWHFIVLNTLDVDGKLSGASVLNNYSGSKTI